MTSSASNPEANPGLREGRSPARPLAPAWLLLAALAMFLVGLGARDIVTSHEARVAQVARRMADAGWPWDARPARVPVSGLIHAADGPRIGPVAGAGTMSVNPWLVPVLNDRIRLQKPPLPYWATASVFRTFGVGEWQARLVPALLGALSTLLVFDVSRRVLGRRAALIAAVAWMTTHFVVDEFRKSTADPYLAFCVLLAVWAWTRRGGRFGWTVTTYAAVGVGMLAKGPAMFVTAVPALALAGVLGIRSSRRKARVEAPHDAVPRRVWRDVWIHALGIALFALIALPWPAYIVRHVPNAIELWRYESIGEFTDNAEKARPWWTYLGASFQAPLPWTPFWVAGLTLPMFRRPPSRWLRSPRNRRRWFALGWFWIAVVIFSFAHVKKLAYLLPAMPAMAMIVGDAIAVTLAVARRGRPSLGFRRTPGVLAAAQAAIGIGFSIGLVVAAVRLSTSAGGWRWGLIGLCVVAAVDALLPVIAIRRNRPGQWFALQWAAYAVLLCVVVAAYAPAADSRRSARAFAPLAYRYSVSSNVPFLLEWLPEELSFYLPLNLPGAVPGDRQILMIVDDRKFEIEQGRLRPDAVFFAPLIDVPPERVVEVRRIELAAGSEPVRWKLYEITLDPVPANHTTAQLTRAGE